MTIECVAPASFASWASSMVVAAEPPPVPARMGALLKPAASRALRPVAMTALRSSRDRCEAMHQRKPVAKRRTFTVGTKQHDTDVGLGQTNDLLGQRVMVDRLVGFHGGGQGDRGAICPRNASSGSHF